MDRLFLLAGLLGLLAGIEPCGTLAQPFRLPVAPALEAGIGISRMEWEEHIVRTSYLPEFTLSLVAPSTFSKAIVFEPTLGLQFDGVDFEATNGYADQYLVTSLRTGLVLLSQSRRRPEGGPFVVGFGLEARRPFFVHAHAYSRTRNEARSWTPLPDPPEFDQWSFFWVIRTGFKYQRFAYLLDTTLDTSNRSLFSELIPANPINYLNIRFSLRTAL